MLQAVLTLADVSKIYNGMKILSGIQLELFAGQVCALIGSNGAGKSTLTKIITGETRMSGGKIFVEGKEANINSPYAAKQLGIISCPQDIFVFGELSVTENLFLGSEITENGILDWTRMEKETKRILDRLHVDISPKRKSKNLSLAEKYLIQFARILLREYKVVVLDELTDSLTMAEVQYVYEVINELKAKGVSVIYITHRIEEAMKIADVIAIMKDGEITACMPAEDAQQDIIVKKMLGDDIKKHYPKLTVARREVVLRVRKIQNKFLNDISFELHRGEVLGIAGLVGSGRTNLLKAIVGLDKLDFGEVEVLPCKPSRKKRIGLQHNGCIGFMPENRDAQGLFMDFSVSHNITIKRLDKVYRGRWISPQKEEEKSADVVGRLGIKTTDTHQKVRYLSGGNKQKTLVGRNVFSNCSIYVFDEPTKGVDIAGKVEIYNIINDLIRKGAAIILVSSDFSELAGMCDRVLVIRKGSLVAELNQTELTQHRLFFLCKE